MMDLLFYFIGGLIIGSLGYLFGFFVVYPLIAYFVGGDK